MSWLLKYRNDESLVSLQNQVDLTTPSIVIDQVFCMEEWIRATLD